MTRVDLALARDGEVNSHNFQRLGYTRLSWGVYGRTPEAPGLDRYQARHLGFMTHVRAVLAAYAGTPVALHGPTALQVLGVELPETLEDWQTCHLAVPPDAYRPARHGVVAHRSERFGIWKHVSGLPVQHPVDHWVQLAGAAMDELVEVGDGLMRRQNPLLTPAQVRRRLDELAGVAGVVAVRRAMRWVVPGTDALYETRTRMIMLRAGLPMPEVNLPVHVRSTGRTYHLDMGYKAERVGVEFDGRVHDGARQRAIDAARRLDLQTEGWFLVTVTASQLANPTQFLGPIEQALAMRRAGLDRVW